MKINSHFHAVVMGTMLSLSGDFTGFTSAVAPQILNNQAAQTLRLPLLRESTSGYRYLVEGLQRMRQPSLPPVEENCIPNHLRPIIVGGMTDSLRYYTPAISERILSGPYARNVACRIAIHPSLVSFCSMLGICSGYMDLSNIGGLYRGNRTYVVIHDDLFRFRDMRRRITQSQIHEDMHALDERLGNVSSSPAFQAAYQSDLTNLQQRFGPALENFPLRGYFGHNLPRSHGGTRPGFFSARQEAFAIFATAILHAQDHHELQHIRQHFPQTHRTVGTILEAINRDYADHRELRMSQRRVGIAPHPNNGMRSFMDFYQQRGSQRPRRP